jgi:hypothetical protein
LFQEKLTEMLMTPPPQQRLVAHAFD